MIQILKAHLLKEKIKNGKVTYGTWIQLAHPEVTEALSNLPFDWMVFDMEHGPLEVPDVELLLMPLRGTNIVPIVRVPWNDFVVIKRVLDIGANGIIVPLVSNKEEAVKAVKAVKYPPHGIRGMGPRRCIMYGFDNVVEYYEKANEEILTIVQVETEEAVKNVEDIVSVEGLDGIFVGPSDLSLSLGLFGQFNHPKFQKTLEKIVEAARHAGKIAGIMTYNENQALDAVNKGFNFIALGSDLGHMIKGYRDVFTFLGVLREVKKEQKVTY